MQQGEQTSVEMHYPVIENAEERLTDACYAKLTELYRDDVSEVVQRRMEKELTAISNYQTQSVFLIEKHIVDDAKKAGQPVGFRGTIGSSFVAFLLGITDINPLPAHYYCPKCGHIEFQAGVPSGYDLPDRICPRCNTAMKGDGQDIPAESFFGIDGEKKPDMSLSLSSEYEEKVKSYLESLLPGNYVVTPEYTLDGKTKVYSGGFMIIPREYANDVSLTDNGKKLTVQNYEGVFILSTRFFKQGIATKITLLEYLRKLSTETGVELETIPMNAPMVYATFRGSAAEDIPCFYPQPEYYTEAEIDTVKRMIDLCKPACFSDLVSICDLIHGTDAWSGNADELLQNGTETLQGIITSREDVFQLLHSKGMPRRQAFEIMEMVGKGKGNQLPDDVFDGYDLPEWYLNSCRRIRYLFPRAHDAYLAKIFVQLMWFKLNYPEEYLRSVSSVYK